jgi:hypothetical protein
MTGRRLYDHYCDETVRQFPGKRGGWNQADDPLPAWSSLSDRSRSRWNALAKRITPKPKPAPRSITLVRIGERKIQGIKEIRALLKCSLLEAKNIADLVQLGGTRKVELPKGVTVKDAIAVLPEWTVVA